MTARPFTRASAIIVFLAFIARGMYAVAFLNELEYPKLTGGGSVNRSYAEFFYEQAAERPAEGHLFEFRIFSAEPVHTALHRPMTAVLLTPAAVVGAGRLGVRLTGAAVGAAVVSFVGLIGARVAGRPAGLLAAGLSAVYPMLWANDGLLLSETYAAFMTATALLCTFVVLRRPSAGRALLLGIACGVAALTRSEVLLVPLLAAPAAHLQD